jgi:prevent-host-death family protein
MHKNTNIITAKELRDNLGEITKRVMNGEQIQVSYRGKPALSIEPIPKKEAGQRAPYRTTFTAQTSRKD